MEFEKYFDSERENIKTEIICVTQHQYQMLEISTDKVFAELEDRSEKLTSELNLNEQQTEGYFKSKHNVPDIDFISQLNTSQRISNELNWVTEHLKILSEMRIIYLFKSVETNLKSIIEIAYPQVDSKYFYRWDNLNTFLKSLAIRYARSEGYNEVDELRRVNNSIKHNLTLSTDIKTILEFNMDSEKINYKNFQSFYSRVKPFASKYVNNIAGAIMAERFEFDDEKITNLSKEFKVRMDEDQLKNFIKRLQT